MMWGEKLLNARTNKEHPASGTGHGKVCHLKQEINLTIKQKTVAKATVFLSFLQLTVYKSAITSCTKTSGRILATSSFFGGFVPSVRHAAVPKATAVRRQSMAGSPSPAA